MELFNLRNSEHISLNLINSEISIPRAFYNNDSDMQYAFLMTRFLLIFSEKRTKSIFREENYFTIEFLFYHLQKLIYLLKGKRVKMIRLLLIFRSTN